ncbi:hypothetical protein M405DRAFT_868274 [Rhizopogon salebrosus TDB-379]|nr:hypothetical protein M405DRAFT_868274 [Rhizopogon salebrosus TDB-379]
MDSREVAAKAPVVDPAKDATRLDKAVENARIGIGFINVLTLSNELVFGKYNERREKGTETNKMVTSFEMHGILSLKEDTALRMIVKPSRLSSEQTYKGQWTMEQTLQEIDFSDTEGLVLASGQHRIAALRKMNKNAVDHLSALEDRNSKLLDMASPEEDVVDEQKELLEEIAEAKGKLGMLGKWGVILYDEGEFSNWSNGMYFCKEATDIVRKEPHNSRSLPLNPLFAHSVGQNLPGLIRAPKLNILPD